ncbi:MAG: hypothetical protein ACK5AZ_21770 [Bryobacteraceae bacterium]
MHTLKIRYAWPGILTVIALTGLAAFLLVGTDAASGQIGERYRTPIVFQRAHLNESTGKVELLGKLWVMEEDGSKLKQITSGMTYDEHPSMYSDQEHVLYSEFAGNAFDRSKGARLVKLNFYTGKREIIAEESGCALHHASLSPMNDRLVYHRDCGERLSQRVGVGPESQEVTMLAINAVALPDSLIFMHEKNRTHSPREVSLVRMYGFGPGARAVFLTDENHLHRRPAVTREGKWLAWQTNAAGREDEIFLAKIDGSEARNLTNAKGNDGHPWFSRDGNWLVFESDRTGQWEIWRIDLKTREQKQLTFGGKRFRSTRARL